MHPEEMMRMMCARGKREGPPKDDLPLPVKPMDCDGPQDRCMG
jgi:hypothetical protein